MAIDDAYSVVLLHFDGTDASTTFTDESGKTWTATGNAQIDTAQSVFGGASGLFDGNDYISTGDSDDFYLPADFTIDFRVRFNSTANSQYFYSQETTFPNNLGIKYDAVNNGLRYFIYGASISLDVVKAWTPNKNTWYHIAWVRNGNNYLSFVDGTQLGTTNTNTNTVPNIPASALIAIQQGGAEGLNGWLDELRISKGIARWTTNFTPPTSAYSPVTGIAGIKTINGIANADIKTINGIAVANIKSVQGLT